MSESDGETRVGDKAASRLVRSALGSNGLSIMKVTVKDREVHVWVPPKVSDDDVHRVLDLGFWIDSGLADHNAVVHRAKTL